MKSSTPSRFFAVMLALLMVLPALTLTPAGDAVAAGVYKGVINYDQATKTSGGYTRSVMSATGGAGQPRVAGPGHGQAQVAVTDDSLDYREGLDYIDIVNPNHRWEAEPAAPPAATGETGHEAGYGTGSPYIEEDIYDGTYEIIPMDKPKQRYLGPSPANPRRTILD